MRQRPLDMMGLVLILPASGIDMLVDLDGEVAPARLPAFVPSAPLPQPLLPFVVSVGGQ